MTGVWLVASEFPQVRFQRLRGVVAGLALAAAGALLIVATHWGHVG